MQATGREPPDQIGLAAELCDSAPCSAMRRECRRAPVTSRGSICRGSSPCSGPRLIQQVKNLLLGRRVTISGALSGDGKRNESTLKINNHPRKNTFHHKSLLVALIAVPASFAGLIATRSGVLPPHPARRIEWGTRNASLAWPTRLRTVSFAEPFMVPGYGAGKTSPCPAAYLR